MPVDPSSAIPLIEPLLKLVARTIKSATGKSMDKKALAALKEAMQEMLRERPDMPRIEALMYGVEQSGHKSLELIRAKERYELVKQERTGRFIAAARDRTRGTILEDRTRVTVRDAKTSASMKKKQASARRPAKKAFKR